VAGVPTSAQAAARGQPLPQVHVVRPGETAYRIARRYGVTVDALAAANGLADPATLRAGQGLRIPGPVGGAARSGTPARGRPAPRAPGSQAGSVALPLRNGGGETADDPLAPDPALPAGAAESLLRQAAPRAVGSDPGLPGGPALGGAGTVSAAEGPAVAEGLAAAARRLVGAPYVWGGTSARGVDCSGLVALVYTPVRPGLPRTSFELFEVGVRVGAGALRPGDLVFFTTYAPGPSHVGIYVGDGQFVHTASSVGRVVASRLADPYYAARFLGARRLLP
jgi:cell wall-associated NlpC family hydrolase